MSPHKEPTRAPTSPVPPHPRHRSRSLHHDSWLYAGTQQHHDYEFHLVDNDFDPAPHHQHPAINDNNRSGTEAGDRHPTSGTSSNGLPTGDRGPDREALVPVRTRRSAVGDRDRLARVELPARRSEPYWLLLDLSDGLAIARSDVRSRRVSRLVRGAFQCGSEHPVRRVALCGLGIVTLAALIVEVL